jgi:3,4-dihydroxy 2-butanone 4-phosphate synthase/GTP cyclohydrolase II
MTALGETSAAFSGREIVLVGGEHDDTVFLACAADRVDAPKLEQLHELGRGMVVLGVAEQIAHRLALPDPWSGASTRREMGLTAPIDAAAGIAGGWSLRDRALTMRVAAHPDSRPGDVTIPGHVYPALIEERHANAAAAAIELARLSGHAPAVALAAVVDRHGRPAALHEARADDRLGRLHVASPPELHAGRIARHADELAVSCTLPTRDGMFRAIGYGPAEGEPATVALVHGDPAARGLPLVHVHVACLFGDAFGSLLCDCRNELDRAVEAIGADGAGVIIYAKPDEPLSATCARHQHVDSILVAGLLRTAGVARLRLLEGGRAAQLRDELRGCGLQVGA